MTPPGTVASYNLVELADGRIATMGKTQLLVSATDGRTWRPLGPPIPTDGAFGLTYSAARNAVYAWKWDCGDVVPAGSVQRLDLGSPAN